MKYLFEIHVSVIREFPRINNKDPKGDLIYVYIYIYIYIDR